MGAEDMETSGAQARKSYGTVALHWLLGILQSLIIAVGHNRGEALLAISKVSVLTPQRLRILNTL